MIIVTQNISSVLGGGGSEQRIILLNVRLEKFPLLLCCEKVLRNQSKYPSGGGGPTKLIFSLKKQLPSVSSSRINRSSSASSY